jgi:hypothetical protein
MNSRLESSKSSRVVLKGIGLPQNEQWKVFMKGLIQCTVESPSGAKAKVGFPTVISHDNCLADLAGKRSAITKYIHNILYTTGILSEEKGVANAGRKQVIRELLVGVRGKQTTAR